MHDAKTPALRPLDRPSRDNVEVVAGTGTRYPCRTAVGRRDGRPANRDQPPGSGLRRQSTNHTSARSAAAIPCSTAMRSNAAASFDDSSTTISVSPSEPALASTA